MTSIFLNAPKYYLTMTRNWWSNLKKKIASKSFLIRYFAFHPFLSSSTFSCQMTCYLKWRLLYFFILESSCESSVYKIRYEPVFPLSVIFPLAMLTYYEKISNFFRRIIAECSALEVLSSRHIIASWQNAHLSVKINDSFMLHRPE